MIKLKYLLPILCASALASAAFAAAPTYVCGLTGKAMKACCCEKQKSGKLLCKNTGKTIEKCCCTTK